MRVHSMLLLLTVALGVQGSALGDEPTREAAAKVVLDLAAAVEAEDHKKVAELFDATPASTGLSPAEFEGQIRTYFDDWGSPEAVAAMLREAVEKGWVPPPKPSGEKTEPDPDGVVRAVAKTYVFETERMMIVLVQHEGRLIFMVIHDPRVMEVRQAEAEARACVHQLTQIHKNMVLYKARNRNRWPAESGIRLLLVLARDGLIEGKNSTVFLCPGTDDINWTEDDPEPGSSYEDWDELDPATISYAGRDLVGFPIERGKEAEAVLLADDNDGRMNHPNITHVLYADGTVRTLKLDELKKQGRVPEDADRLIVGPDSPLVELRCLRID